MVISFSVINYVVSMRHPRVSDEVSFFLYMLYIKKRLIYPQSSHVRTAPRGIPTIHYVQVGRHFGSISSISRTKVPRR